MTRHLFPAAILTCIALLPPPALASGAAECAARAGIPKLENSVCPTGYRNDRSCCVPISERSRRAIPRSEGRSCPSGYLASGSGCVAFR